MSGFGNWEVGTSAISDAASIAAVLEAFFYGLYCLIFGQYLHVYRTKRKNERSIIVYPLIMLFVLSTSYFVLNLQVTFWLVLRPGTHQDFIWNVTIISIGIYGFSDFICQSILIYRCWVMWDYLPLLVVIPSIMALTLLGTILVLIAQLSRQSPYNESSDSAHWIFPLAISSFCISLVLNAVVTGLLVLRIILIRRQSRSSTAHTNRRLYDLSPVISILIETGMMTFVSQLILAVVVGTRNASAMSFGSPMIILYGLTPTIVVVRVAMRTLYDNHDRTSAGIQSSMTFATNHDVQTEATRTAEIPLHDLISAGDREKKEHCITI